MILIVAVIGIGGAAGVLRAADARTADVERIDGLESVLADVPGDDAQYPARELPARRLRFAKASSPAATIEAFGDASDWSAASAVTRS